MAHVRRFGTGATRDALQDKPDYEGYLHPSVIRRFGEYMLAHQHTAEGVRASDNWQLGIPRKEYMSSLLRHCLALWEHHRGVAPPHAESVEEVCCAMMFNVQGYLFETLREKTGSSSTGSSSTGE